MASRSWWRPGERPGGESGTLVLGHTILSWLAGLVGVGLRDMSDIRLRAAQSPVAAKGSPCGWSVIGPPGYQAPLGWAKLPVGTPWTRAGPSRHLGVGQRPWPVQVLLHMPGRCTGMEQYTGASDVQPGPRLLLHWFAARVCLLGQARCRLRDARKCSGRMQAV
jgi:hypothetical protein